MTGRLAFFLILLSACATRVVYRDAPNRTESYAVVTWRTLRFNSITGAPVWSRQEQRMDIKTADEVESTLTQAERAAIRYRRTNFVVRTETVE